MAPPFDLNSQYQSPFDTLQMSRLGGNGNMDMGSILAMLIPYLRETEQARARGRAELPRQVQAIKGGGRRDMSGNLINPDPIKAQEEHETLWRNMFTSPQEAIAKERIRFATPEGMPTFTEQQIARIYETPQQKINKSMGGGWENLSPTERRVRLQTMHGQTPDFFDPMTNRPTQGLGTGVGNASIPAQQTPAPTPLNVARPQAAPAPDGEAIARREAARRSAAAPAQPQAAPHPASVAPSPAAFQAQQAEVMGRPENRPDFAIFPRTTPTVPYRGQQIPAVPGGGFNMNQLILDEAERVRQLGLQRQAEQAPMWSRIAQTIAPMTDITGGYQSALNQPAPVEPELPQFLPPGPQLNTSIAGGYQPGAGFPRQMQPFIDPRLLDPRLMGPQQPRALGTIR